MYELQDFQKVANKTNGNVKIILPNLSTSVQTIEFRSKKFPKKCKISTCTTGSYPFFVVHLSLLYIGHSKLVVWFSQLSTSPWSTIVYSAVQFWTDLSVSISSAWVDPSTVEYCTPSTVISANYTPHTHVYSLVFSLAMKYIFSHVQGSSKSRRLYFWVDSVTQISIEV